MWRQELKSGFLWVGRDEMSTQSKPEGNGAGVDDEVVCGCDEILEDKQDVDINSQHSRKQCKRNCHTLKVFNS